MSDPFIRVRNLCKSFPVRKGLFGRARPLHAVANVSFEVPSGMTFGLVGESGSGKSTIAKVLLGAEKATSGSVEVGGHNLSRLDRRATAALRRAVQPVLQDPYSSLNPGMRIGDIVEEPLRIHKTHTDARARRAHVGDLLEQVGLDRGLAGRYPHALSGGQKQRVAIARALGLRPLGLILDEPVSALDVSIQAQILNLLRGLQRQFGLSYVLISHDLGVVSYMSDRIGVLYLGEFVEIGDRDGIVSKPFHPYTQALIDASESRIDKGPVGSLARDIPSPMQPPPGCPFHTRCPYAAPLCTAVKPILEQKADGRWVACHFAGPAAAFIASDRGASHDRVAVRTFG